MKLAKQNLQSFMNQPILKSRGVVPRKEGFWYAFGIAGQNVSCGLVGWFYYFCTDVAYYNMAVIGIVLSSARIWDAVNDPLMGVLIDRFRFKNGEKLRPWLRIAPIVAGFTAMLMFIKPGFTDQSRFWQGAFIMIIYLIYDMSFTVQDISMWGMTAVMSPVSEERGRLAQWGRIGASAGSWLPGLISVFISLSEKTGLSEKTLFVILGVVMGLGGMLVSMLSSLSKERLISVPSEEGVSLKDNLGDLFQNRTVMMVLLGSILSGLALTIPQVYFFKYKVDMTLFGMHIDGMMANFLYGIVSGLPGTLAMLIAPWLAKKCGGMKNILILSCVSAIVMRFVCFATGYEGNKMIIVTLLMAVASIPAGVTGIAMTALFGDSIDYMEWKTGRRAEAITFAAQTFASKIVGAINTGISTGLLVWLQYSAADFEAGLPLSPLFDKWIWPLFILGPVVGSVLNLIPLLFIKYPNSLKMRVEKELRERRQKETAPAQSSES